MPENMTSDAKRSTLNLRITPEDRELIDRAAEVRRLNRTQFVLGAARDAAADVIFDQTLIQLDPEAYERFVAALDGPGKPNERLVRTMSAVSPWPET